MRTEDSWEIHLLIKFLEYIKSTKAEIVNPPLFSRGEIKMVVSAFMNSESLWNPDFPCKFY